MAYPIESKLVVGITSTALFDFSVEHQIFEQEGVEAFRSYQEANRGKRPQPGTAFPFIKRLLNLNRIFPGERPVEECSFRPHPFRSIPTDASVCHGLAIRRMLQLSRRGPRSWRAVSHTIPLARLGK